MANKIDVKRALAGDKGLREAALSYADLRGADLTDVDLRDVNLFEAKLEGADLTGAKLLERQIYYDLEDSSLTVGMEKGDIISSETNPETYRVVSVKMRSGKAFVNIVNTKNKKRYTKRVYQDTPIGSRVTLYVKNRAGDIFTSR